MLKEKTSCETLTQNVNIRMDACTDGLTDKRRDGQTDKQTTGWTERQKLYTPQHTFYARDIKKKAQGYKKKSISRSGSRWHAIANPHAC